MQIARTIDELHNVLRGFNHPSFVPTMGNLHEGHLALLAHARTLGDVSVASIFVNRLQFLPHEDFESYPRTWTDDCERLAAAGCDVLFAPLEAELYPQAQDCRVHPPAALADVLEGQFRPGFFVGVCTVVLKLFNCVFAQAKGSRTAVFGKKDYQQLMVIRHMVRQLSLPIDIAAVDTVRASDGLALSSRNSYLTPSERCEAIQLAQVLRSMAEQSAMVNADFDRIEANAMHCLIERGWQPDYMAVRRRADLAVPRRDGAEPLVVLGAARLGATRLIDNLEVAVHDH